MPPDTYKNMDVCVKLCAYMNVYTFIGVYAHTHTLTEYTHLYIHQKKALTSTRGLHG